MNNVIELTKSFYDKSSVIKAISAYKSIAIINMQETSYSYECQVITSNYDPQLVLNEFANYVLGTMNS